MPPSPLPIDPLLPEICAAVSRSRITVIEAEPGAGKTTRVPSALLNAGLEDIYVLEPRRMAARMAARRVAQEMGEPIGRSVGYQVRFEQTGGRDTHLWFVTEGVFTRKMLNGEIARLRVAVLDEFHERHIETDTALALLHRTPQVRIVIMSATLNAQRIAERWPDVTTIKSPGRVFPVSVEYTPVSSDPLEVQAERAVSKALQATSGHVLVFLPGAAEINRTLRACEHVARQAGARALPLYGDLSIEDQDAAVLPSANRRIICSTNIAESSLTIEGVTAVVDSGLARVMKYSPWTGLSHLELARIPKSSALQRAGRAGRTGPGVCIRLYPESDFVRRPADIEPEILRADLAQLALDLKTAGLDWNDLDWLDEPPQAARLHADQLLQRLGRVRELACLPVHPRLARMLVAAQEFGCLDDAIAIVAQLEERNEQVQRKLERQIENELKPVGAHEIPHALEKAVLLGFPDRVKRTGNLLSVEIDDARLSYAIQPDWLLDFFPNLITEDESLEWNREGQRVEQVSRLRYEDVIIDETRSAPRDPDAASKLLAEKALDIGLSAWADAEAWDSFRKRVAFAASYGASVPPDLLRRATELLATGLSSLTELKSAARDGGLVDAAQTLIDTRLLDAIAPTHIQLPSGRRARIEYHEDRPPSVASRLQDFFGMKETPTIARGAAPLVVELLAPNHRPVQVTTDLVSFWKNLYPQVRKELSRRYPKHAWPERPETGTR